MKNEKLMNNIVNKVRNKFDKVLNSGDNELISNYKDLFEEDKEYFLEALFDGSEENIVGGSCEEDSEEYEFLCKEDFDEDENEVFVNKLGLLFDEYKVKFLG